MKKLFTAIRQGKLDEVKSIIEKKPELVNCVSGALPKKDRGHYPEPYSGPSNKSMFIDDFVPATETDINKKKELRAFMQEYFKTRKLHV